VGQAVQGRASADQEGLAASLVRSAEDLEDLAFLDREDLAFLDREDHPSHREALVSADSERIASTPRS